MASAVEKDQAASWQKSSAKAEAAEHGGSSPYENGVLLSSMGVPLARSSLAGGGNLITLDTRLALKIDSCESMTREIRRKVSELADETAAFVRSQRLPVPMRPLPSYDDLISREGFLDVPDQWS